MGRPIVAAMLRRVAVQNFRAIGGRELSLELSPLQLLCGANGTGKTSVLQAIALTAQSATQTQYERRGLLLDGPLVRLGSSLSHVCHRHDLLREMRVRTEFQTEGHSSAYEWGRRGEESNPYWAHELKIDNETLWKCPAERVAVSRDSPRPAEKHVFVSQGESLITEYGWAPPSILDRRQLEQVIQSGGGSPRFEGVDRGAFYSRVSRSIGDAVDVYRGIRFLSDLRGRELVTLESGKPEVGIGRAGQDLARSLVDLKARKSAGMAKVKEFARKFGLEAIEAGSEDATRIQVSYRDLSNGAELELADAASGAIAGLTLLAALFLNGERQTLLLEEPESHLHPRYVVTLAEAIADAIHAGHQVVLTTHSGLLIHAIGLQIRLGNLRAEQVGCAELFRDDTEIGVKAMQFDSEGHLEPSIPGFLDVDVEMFHAWQTKRQFALQDTKAEKRKPSGDRRPRPEKGGPSRGGPVDSGSKQRAVRKRV